MLLKGCYNLKKLPSEMQNLINLRHLDIKGVRLYEGMPLGIKDLTSVRTLSDFVAGRSGEAGITALLNLKFLRGAHCISMLQNVANASDDVREPILMDNERIDSLAVGWGFQNTPDESRDRDVLDRMQPHENLKKLTMVHYGGTEFPLWIDDPLFHNLVRLKLEDCKNCVTLPHLGLLSSLRNLVIERFPNVKVVDHEFYGEGNLNPFPALETLHLKSMRQWEYWNGYGVEFPRLLELSIIWCPKLLGQLPSHLPSLQNLVIEQCLQLVVSFQSLPLISHLQIEECRKLELGGGFSSANLMKVYGELFLFPPEEFMQGLRKLEMLTIGRDVRVYPFLSCPRGPCWVLFEGIIENEELLQRGIADSEIEILEFRRCKSLQKLPPWLHSIKSLRELLIEGCARLISLPDAVIYSSLCLEELKIESCDSLISIGRHQLPPTLKWLQISRCQKLQRLLDEDIIGRDPNSSNLQHLKIDDCGSLTFLGKLPPSLKDLVITSFGFDSEISAKLESIAERFNSTTSLESIKIGYLPNLKSLPENLHMLTSLHNIWIYNCPSLVSFPQGGLPTLRLKSLTVDDCEKLEVLPDNMHNLTSLQELIVKNCPSLVYFPQGGLPIAHLRKLRVEFCEKLKTLPHNMHNLTCLEELTLKYCPSIVSFPEEGFPTNLTSVCIHKVEICKPLNWHLHRLTSLKKLSITGKCHRMVSFPQDEIDMKLPASLTNLTIEGFQDLIYLSNKGFQSLTSLEYLRIERCPKLAYFPKNGLPPSLLQLHIHHCPLLQQRCQKGKRKEKSEDSELAQIPLVFQIPPLKRKNEKN
ncbi:putative disease resistance protein At3g14460 [Hevea brasiliensis]|uniref:putative disease resistance protein At3g14460 n=1 Tax=Hevea brasiliensis TaxID=3981 RepID=UPI0025FF5E0C|nr:putative disease resistance protein At3g14460 [Hevea brasiliensis]XP_058006950.1 putative disease resistance protein At3g14460 [Hevea brasiliensis]XP_058006951.1 putative disease resistance protein At3g14460 [Hevea brasiliensis]